MKPSPAYTNSSNLSEQTEESAIVNNFFRGIHNKKTK